MQVELGPCAQFSIYHLMCLEEGEEGLKLKNDSNALYHQSVAIIGAGIPQSPRPISLEPANKKPILPDLHQHILDDTHFQMQPRTLGDIARVLRSKNAGPYEITFDVMFASKQTFELVKASAFLNPASIAKTIGIEEKDVIWSGFFDQALAYKATIARITKGKVRASGGFMENDVHGSQQYIGLLNMLLPKKFLVEWEELVGKRREDSVLHTPTTPTT